MADGSHNHGALANIDPTPILERIRAGDSLRQIAADVGVSNVGLRAWLLREDREQYADVVTAALTTRVATADDMLETASDAVSIARAREMARFARMDLERRRPHLYGQRPTTAIQVSGEGGVSVQIVSYAAPSEAQIETQTIDASSQLVDASTV